MNFGFVVEIVSLVLTLVFIVASAELFTNGIEWLGQRLQLSEGVVGSVLAAVGTALPETLIPVVALIFFSKQHGVEVGIGAIAGAPFMLSTLTLGICGIACLAYTASKRRKPGLEIKKAVIKRDLKFFIVAYSLALLGTLLPPEPALRYLLAGVLILLYPYYLYVCFRHEGEVGECPETLYLDRLFKVGSERFRLIIPQIILSLAGIVGGAYLFVGCIQNLSDDFNISPLVLSLIVTPIATELPEKINSVLWLRGNKDTLAIGNVTGALVFQSCFPVAFGVACTSWNLDHGTLLSGCVAVFFAGIYLALLSFGRLKPQHLVFGAVAYIATISTIIYIAPVMPPRLH
ncbi:sodium:calcium antiporter [bacterium]|nr:sodium:calcium antiporter [bacterium]